MCLFFSFQLNRKASDLTGSSNIIDNVSSSKAHEMIAELCITEEQLKENGFPRSGPKPGMATIYKPQNSFPTSEDDRYCRRCGKLFKLSHYDDECVDQCNYHPKSPGFRRGGNFFFYNKH